MNKEKLIKVVLLIATLVSWIVAIGMGVADKKTNVIIFLTIALTIGTLIAFFGKKFYEMLGKTEEGIPKAISPDKVKELMYKKVESLWNHVLINEGIEWDRQKPIKQQLIWAMKINLLYEESFGKSCIMILNANYPDDGITILPGSISNYYVERAMNSKARNHEEPDILEKETSLDDFGRPIEKVKETKHKPKENKSKEGSVV